MSEEKFVFTAGAKKNLLITGAIGLVLFIIGIFAAMSGGHGHDDHHASVKTELVASAEEGMAQPAEEAHHHGSPVWLKRVYATLWYNNIFFAGIALIGVFFVAIHYASQAGWSAGFKRVPEAFSTWLPIAGLLTLVLYFIVKHDIFHWTHAGLYEKGGPEYDEIIAGKSWYLNEPFYLGRMIVFFAVWILFDKILKKHSIREDLEGGHAPWKKMRVVSAGFIVFFAYSTSIAAWDWLMSIDTHWFSTMYGWYTFASWWVSGLALIMWIVLYLKDQGYLPQVNANHIHDLGKFIFGFSIFWTYIWLSQFLLIYYANIPEESAYFIPRLHGHYAPTMWVILVLNFVLPFLLLMTRDAKRHATMLKLVCTIVVLGHWIDFYQMVVPGVMKGDGSFGALELGTGLIFLSAFLFVMFTGLSKVPLVAKNHPMLEESLHHHI